MNNDQKRNLSGEGKIMSYPIRARSTAPEVCFRPVPPNIPVADYSDEVTPQQIEQIKALVDRKRPDSSADEWELVDGPAW